MNGSQLIERITALKSQDEADALLSEYAKVVDERTARGNMTYFASNVGGTCAANLRRYGLHVNANANIKANVAFYPIREDAMVTIMLDVDGSSGDKTLELDIAQAMQECFALFKQRQRKYGPGNIARSGELGCLIRTSDKLARLENYYINGNVADFPDDSLEDAWKDSSVYALIALLCHRGKWPGWTPTQRSLAGGPATTPLDPAPSGGC